MYEHQTEDKIKSEILDHIDINANKGEGSDLNAIAAGPAIVLSGGYAELDYLVDLITGKTRDKSLIEYAADFGVFHKKGEKASSIATIAGGSGTTISAGTMMKNQKNLVYVIDDEVVIGESPVQINFTAEDVGYKYNDDPGELQLIIDNPGVVAITHNGITGGVDVESLDSLGMRLDDRLKKPSSSGNENDYIGWAESIVGVTKCKVIPLWNGDGTVKCIVYGENGKPLSSEKLTEVSEYMELMRPILAKVTVVTVTNLMATIKIVGLSADSKVGESVVKENIELAIASYIDSIEPGDVLVYKKLLSSAMAAKGVLDLTDLLVNGSSVNITSTEEQKVKMGNVTYEA